MGSAIGGYMTKRSMDKQNQLLAKAQGKQMWAEKEAENKKAAEATTPDYAEAVNIQKKKKGVQSTFLASKTDTYGTGGGALAPIGG